VAQESVHLEFFGFGAELRSDVPEVVAYCRDVFAAAVVAHAGPPQYRLEVLRRADETWTVRDPWIRDAVVRRADWLPGIVAARLLEAVGNGVEDRYLFHAAAVGRNGRGLILAGDSGFGKSTLALGLVERGFLLLSDEVAVVDARDGRLEPFPKTLELRPATASLFGIEPQRLSPRTGKQLHDLTREFPTGVGGPCVPAAIVFLAIEPLGSKVGPRTVRVLTHARDDAVVPDIARLEGVAGARWEDGSPAPVLVLDADPLRLRGWEIEDVLGRRGLLVVSSSLDAMPPRDFDRPPQLDPIPAHAGIAALLARARGSRAATRYAERHGGLGELFLSLTDRLGGVRFYRLTPGRLRESLELLESTLATSSSCR